MKFFQLIYFILFNFFRLGCSATSCLTRSWWPLRTQSTFWLRKRKSNFSKRSSRTSTRPSLLSSSWSETRWFQFYQIPQLIPAFSVLVETFSKISYWRISYYTLGRERIHSEINDMKLIVNYLTVKWCITMQVLISWK